MNISWLILLIIIGIVVGIFGVFQLQSGDYGGDLGLKEINDIGNGTYFEISVDELKEQPEIAKSIRGGEGCTKSDYGGWSCKLTEQEVSNVSAFLEIKRSKYLFSIDMKFRKNLDENKIDAELVNIFNSNGFPLTEKYSTLVISFVYNPYNRWFINKEVNTPEYIVWEIKDELKVYKGYIDYQFVKIGEQYYEIHLAVT